MSVKSLYKNKWFKLALLLLMAGVIFLFSSQPGEDSSKVSGFFSEKVIYILEYVLKVGVPGAVKAGFAGIDHYVRKFGHFFEYFLLGLLAVNYFLCIIRNDNKSATHYVNLSGLKKKVFCISFAFCAAYAASDEFHQRFVPGRGPSVKDVLLDTVAATAAVTVYLLLAGKKYNTTKEEYSG